MDGTYGRAKILCLDIFFPKGTKIKSEENKEKKDKRGKKRGSDRVFFLI